MTNKRHFLVEKQKGIVLLKVNRPNVLNALSLDVLDELSLILDELLASKDVRGMIFTGEGKAFIAGADIKEMSTLSRDQALSFSRKGQMVTRKLETLPFPVVAAVNGFALGGGCEFAISCDFIFASTKAVFGQPEVALGLIPGFGGCARLARFVGWPRAKELIFSGRKIKADEAFRIGLVNHVFEPEQLLPETYKFFESLQLNSPIAISKSKQAMDEITQVSKIEDRLLIEAQKFSDIFNTHDQKEGTKAFLEKRKAEFKGM